MKVRPATLDDLDALVEGNEAMARETESKVLDHGTIHEGVRAVLAAEQLARYFVVDVDGQVAAQLMLTFEWSDWRNGKVWWIQSVYVSEAHRKKGYYRALYEHVRDEAIRQEAVGIRLYVDDRNTSAKAVYAKLGMDGGQYQVFEDMFG